ncbi:MAG: twin-arginine translocation signal domain-containing protein, partial [Acidimicrobiia bacterium]
MDITRRDFLGATATAAVASLQRTPSADDPLGVRGQFPALRDYTFLNTAYTGLIPQVVVDASREWIATRAGRTFTVGEM